MADDIKKHAKNIVKILDAPESGSDEADQVETAERMLKEMLEAAQKAADRRRRSRRR